MFCNDIANVVDVGGKYNETCLYAIWILFVFILVIVNIADLRTLIYEPTYEPTYESIYEPDQDPMRTCNELDQAPMRTCNELDQAPMRT